MQVRILVTLVAMTAALGACAQSPPAPALLLATELTDDLAERVDRLRGCWIAREGSGAVFLRLLPPFVDAPVIEGGVDRTGTSTVERLAILSFTRDGVSASLATRGSEPVTLVADKPSWAPAGKNWLVYSSVAKPTLFLLIEAPGETLRIMTTLGPEPGPMALSPLYEAKRDGCD